MLFFGPIALTTSQARLLGDGGWLDLLDWVAHLGDLVDAVVVGEDSRDGTNKDLGVGDTVMEVAGLTKEME